MFKSQAGRGSDFSPRIVLILVAVLMSSCWGGFRLLTMSFEDIESRPAEAAVQSEAVAVGASDLSAVEEVPGISTSALRDINEPFIDELTGRSYSCDIPPRSIVVRNEASIFVTGETTFNLVLGDVIWQCIYWD